MSFILLRRTTDGEIHLLSNSSWSGRGDAMAELSRITAAPTFDRWDDEVLLVDVDSGTPILMVRPAAPEAVADEPGPVSEIAATDTALADADDGEPQDVDSPAEGALDAPEAGDGGESDAVDEPDAVEDTADDSSEETAEEAGIVEDDTASSTDDEIAALLEDLDAPEAVPSTPPSLKEALERSAARLEAEGIVAPESVGPAPAPDESAPEATPVEAVTDDSAAEPVPVPDEAPAAWPWDTAPEEKAFDLDAFEESHDQSESLVRAPGDDETLSFAKPVILGGEYADVVPATVVEAPAPAPEPVAETPAPEPATETDATGSDFIDLGPAEPAAPAPMVSDELSALTCADCVYDATCPNRGQLLPASCGSFQWK